MATAVTCALLSSSRACVANPQGGHVVLGLADIIALGHTMNINQYTMMAIINWQRFSIAPWETVNFNQPNAFATTLNRVIGNERSVIEGALNANGRVFIVNSAGILFTKNAQVNVGGLVASTLDISNRDFSEGKYLFSGQSKASVINQGDIRARPGGFVALLGKHVSNEGAIDATLGSVALASGEKITLNFGGDSLLDVTVNKGTLNALVENKGLIKADGGRVVLTARAADALLSAQVNNSGVIQARTMAGLTGGSTRTGSIKLAAIGGRVRVAGRLDASAPRGGRGGAIETSGSKVTIARDAVVTTRAASGNHGDWLISSHGFTIGAGGNVSGSQLSRLLGMNNISIRSEGSGKDGDINIAEDVTWSANTNLNLDARNNINIFSALAASGESAGLSMRFGRDYVFKNSEAYIGLTGSRASLKINGQSYILINTLAELADLSENPDAIASGFYALGRDIDAAGVYFTGPLIYALDGTLAGLGHKISNLTIVDADGRHPDAMIGVAGATAIVRDITLANANIFAGDSYAGGEGGTAAALVNTNYGVISNAYAIGGSVYGVNNVGGLVANNLGSIFNSGSAIKVTGRSTVGGLVGLNFLSGIIKGSYADGPIFAGAPVYLDGSLEASQFIGGLVGQNGGIITESRANAAITTYNSADVGGLVGLNINLGFGLPGGEITKSYATGWINATWENRFTLGFTGVGGLVGWNYGGTILDTRAGLTISLSNLVGQYVPMNGVGGLVGVNDTAPDETGGVIRRSVSTTDIYNDGWVDAVGGLVGYASGGSITGNFASGKVTSGPEVYPGGAAGLIGNIFNPDAVVLRGNRWDIYGTGQSNGVGFGAGPSTPGVIGIGDPTRPPSLALSTAESNRLRAARQIAVSAGQTGDVIATNSQSSASSTPDKRIASAGTAATEERAGPSLDEEVKTSQSADRPSPKPKATTASLGSTGRLTSHAGAEDENAHVHRRPAAPAAQKVGPPKPKPPEYGAAIRSIEIDGKRFDLQEKAPPAAKPTPNP